MDFSEQLFVIVFLLLVVIPYSGYGVLLGYGVMLLVTPPQAAKVGMVRTVVRVPTVGSVLTVNPWLRYEWSGWWER